MVSQQIIPDKNLCACSDGNIQNICCNDKKKEESLKIELIDESDVKIGNRSMSEIK
jgi:hypothetical protein